MLCCSIVVVVVLDVVIPVDAMSCGGKSKVRVASTKGHFPYQSGHPWIFFIKVHSSYKMEASIAVVMKPPFPNSNKISIRYMLSSTEAFQFD